MKRMLLLTLCLLLAAVPALAETREAVVTREGNEEIVQETLFESSYGFSFWYADEWLEAYEGEPYMPEEEDGVYVGAVDESGCLEFTVITGEEADEWILEHDDVDYSEGENGTDILYFQEPWDDGLLNYEAVITYGTHAVFAFGWWPESMDAVIGESFRRAVLSLNFGQQSLVTAEWMSDEPSEDGLSAVRLTVADTVTNLQLLNIVWLEMDDTGIPAFEEIKTVKTWDRFTPDDELMLMVEFTGEMPNNGVAFTDARGVRHRLVLDISGEDGRLYFWSLDELLAE